ncbi:helix-turn-helix domain-containing protein [Halobacillus karajensis]|uniref:HTH-type transcriptional regulator ImmR n=1 Tax=Halobacillus karajensis TaxID=195088 RepID=A0A059NZ33_9BACI|nr:helix-turn-helix transcriptional regulator [Halobacillus karajensis]CDQ20331.1 HTH-type transcriptional regulator ImmR [Halobacillus karajensis]CDQ23601.1 HTH-type transcriptional regulator ImmR [Halobacillus karajensis]CDQ27080.1 HTH-type transcriptional regulator ImmR [Halobacillus karajensis]
MLSQRLKYSRKTKGLTQNELANKIKTTKGTISNYENGYSTPSNEMLISLANALDVSVDYLLGRSETTVNETKENEYNTINEINKLMDKYGIEDAAFFDLEKWKAMGPEQIRELESYFKYLLRRSKELENKNKE